MEYQANASPFQSWRPFAREPAISLTQNLPPEIDAKCLILGCGDARNILFTIFNDENDHFKRSYDFTCCDIEPAVLARNILLFTLLIDGTDDCTLLEIMHNLALSREALDIIRDQSAKLASLSKDLPTWASSPYACCLRLVNSQTAEKLRKFWKLYSGNAYLTPSFLATYCASIKATKKTIPPHAWGPTTHMHEMFWDMGDYDCTIEASYCVNPLFVYSDIGGTRFAVHKESHMGAGFHFVTAVENVCPKYELNPWNWLPGSSVREHLLSITGAFHRQFLASCAAFRRLFNSNPRRLRIRYFAGDAIAFCMGLRQLREPGYIANCYTRPGSMEPLVLDGEDSPQSGDHTPTKFNVIETGYLIDRIGLLNLLPKVINALDSPASVLYTSTRVETVADETKLMEKLLCGDVSAMCALLGVVPSAYLSGYTFQAIEENSDLEPVFDDSSLTNRIVWVPTTSTDCKVDIRSAKVRCDLDEMVKHLTNVYVNMFSHERDPENSANRWYKYTRRSFISLLAFLKTRAYCDWRKCPSRILRAVHEDETNHTLICQHRHEIFCELDRFDLQPLPSHVRNAGNLPREDMVLILTVARSTIKPIYTKLASRSLPIAFQMSVQPNGPETEPRIITSVQYCFGKWDSENSDFSSIVEDVEGWQGTGDLHVWAYVTRSMIEGEGSNSFEVGLSLTPEKEVVRLFRSNLGPKLSISKGTVSTRTMEGHHQIRIRATPPKLQITPIPAFNFDGLLVDSEVAKRTSSFLVDYPLLNIDKQVFTTRVNVLGDALKSLQRKENISIEQPSTCTLAIKFGGFQVTCNYSFPVDYTTTKLRVSRVEGWIEVNAPLVSPSRRGQFASSPFPIVRSGPKSGIRNCFVPYVNFSQLAPLDGPVNFCELISAYPTLKMSDIVTSISDDEPSAAGRQLKARFESPTRSPLLNSMERPPSLLGHAPFRLGVFDEERRLRNEFQPAISMIFFILGPYLDFNSRDVVVEAYMAVMTGSVPTCRPDDCVMTDSRGFSWWMDALPSMVESARQWEHNSNCEYETKRILPSGSLVCSCGQGKVGEGFKKVKEWKEFTPYVTKVAIRPFFSVPWLTPRRAIDVAGRDGGENARERTGTTAATTDATKVTTTTKPMTKECKFCSKKDAGKKCGKCMSVTYCSRECQAKDWSEHKKVCGLKEARIG